MVVHPCILSVSGELAITVDVSKPVSRLGDTIDVRCHVTNDEREQFYIIWVKKVGTEETEIGTNKKINDPFQPTGRYAADVEFKVANDLADVTFVLHIKDLEAKDSGEIGCKIPKAGLEVFASLTVQVPFKSMGISSKHLDGTHHVTYSNGQEVSFDEGERRQFSCRASGGYPQPEMTMTLDGKPLSKVFNKTTDLELDGLSGLQDQTYDIEMSNPRLEVTYEYAKKTLTCEASIPGTDFKNSTSISIKLNGYKPQFFCDNVKLVALHEEDVNLTCTVHADPPITNNLTMFYWNRVSSGNDSVKPGDVLGHMEGFLENGANANEKKLTLRIGHVYIHDFRTYNFEATNDLGTVVYGLELERNPNYMTVTIAAEVDKAKEVPGTRDSIDGAPRLLEVSVGLLVMMIMSFILV